MFKRSLNTFCWGIYILPPNDVCQIKKMCSLFVYSQVFFCILLFLMLAEIIQFSGADFVSDGFAQASHR